MQKDYNLGSKLGEIDLHSEREEGRPWGKIKVPRIWGEWIYFLKRKIFPSFFSLSAGRQEGH